MHLLDLLASAHLARPPLCCMPTAEAQTVPGCKTVGSQPVVVHPAAVSHHRGRSLLGQHARHRPTASDNELSGMYLGSWLVYVLRVPAQTIRPGLVRLLVRFTADQYRYWGKVTDAKN